jgi:hypothetical protein
MEAEKSRAERLAEKLEGELAGISADYWRLSKRLAKMLPLAMNTHDWASGVQDSSIEELARAVRLSVVTAKRIDELVGCIQGEAAEWRFELQEERSAEKVPE